MSMRARKLLATVLVASLALGAPAWAADTAAVLLEKGLYAEETQGDMAAAIKIYKQITASAASERATVAQALLRLGLCYLKTGQKDDAAASFQKLAKEYPEQKQIVARIPAVPAAALKLDPAPWEGEEALVLRVKMADATDGGVMIFRVEPAQVGGKAAYRIETYRAPMLFTSVDVAADTFLPIESRAENKMMASRSRSVYAPGRVEVTLWDKAGEAKKHEVKSEQAVYDNDEVIHLMRRLPLAEGYSLKIPVLAIGSPVTIEAKIDVVGREKVTVAAGTFDTHKVNLGVFMDGRHVQDQQFWYSADANRYLVKVFNVVSIELEEVLTGSVDKSAFQDAAAGFSLDAPDGWYVISRGTRGGGINLGILAPEMKVVGGLRREPFRADAKKTAAQMAEEHIDWAKKNHSVYAVRGDAAESFQASGLPATRIVGEFTHKLTGRSTIEYRTFVAHQGHRLTFEFEVDKEQWESVKPAIDEVVASLRLQ
jgi:tetratricopeptide (TPR) repeat protein